MSVHDETRPVFTEDSRPHAQARAIADQDLDLTPLSSSAPSPSSPRLTERLSSSPRLQNETDQAPSADTLLEVVADLQAAERAALEDRDLADREIRRLRREADQLRRELQQAREEDPKSRLIREVCDHWIKALGKTKRTKCPVNGARWNKVRARMNDGYTVSQLKAAIDGCAARPFVGPHGRQPTDEHGAKRHDDLELICRDETTVERFIGYSEQPAEPEREPESLERQFVRHVYGDDCTLPYKPASKEPRLRPPSPGAPIDRVLGALHGHGCQVVTYQAHNDQWSAQCPVHEDRSPSLSVHRKADGKVLVHCFAGCETQDVLAELGLEFRDLWEDSEHDPNSHSSAYREPRLIAPHLRSAMQMLLAADERRAA